jgi:SAM-dependent methyltransferase
MANTRSSAPVHEWHPPSTALRYVDGLWQSTVCNEVLYPESGNDHCLQVEATSYWFRHRLDSIRTLVNSFPTEGPLYDIGGGNGQVALALQSSGQDVVLVEPGVGAINALNQGARKVIRSTFEDCRFHPASLNAVSAFDVVEHIKDDTAFFSTIRDALALGGRFFCTVPAAPNLWSVEDERAGHQRRYTSRSLVGTLQNAGFKIEFCSHLFSWLFVPIAILRSLPHRLGRRQLNVDDPISLAYLKRDHRLPPWLSPCVRSIHRTELKRIERLRPIPFGTSLICVAQVTPRS